MKHRLSLLILAVLLALSTHRVSSTKAQTLTAPRIAMSSPESTVSIAALYGPIHYGPEFGLTMTAENFTYFNTPALAVQTVFAGQNEIVGISFAAAFLLQEAGQDYKVFCLRNGGSDTVLASRHGITKVEQLLDPKTRVALDSPGGVADLIINAIFQANGIKATTKDLKNVTILESAAERAAALAADTVDVSVFSLVRYRALEKTASDLVMLGNVYEDTPLYLSSVYAAPTKWLNENQAVSTAFCASVIKAQRELTADFKLYDQAIKELIAKPPSDDSIKETWELIGKHDMWRLKDGLDVKSVDFVGEMILNGGLIKQKPTADIILDLRPLEAALKLLPPMESTPDVSATEKP
jgi:ABC-type nitrate/sulfonate/bicarbonate transport system substrate-binding protein